MTTYALLELRLNADTLDDASKVLRRVLGETRGFDGCLGIDVLVDVEDRLHWTLLERWQSAAHHRDYQAFRSGPGAVRDLGQHLTGRPVLTTFETNQAL